MILLVIVVVPSYFTEVNPIFLRLLFARHPRARASVAPKTTYAVFRIRSFSRFD